VKSPKDLLIYVAVSTLDFSERQKPIQFEAEKHFGLLGMCVTTRKKSVRELYLNVSCPKYFRLY
jgi:hypothetical protein